MCIGMAVTCLQEWNVHVLDIKLFKYALKLQMWQLNGALSILLNGGTLSKYSHVKLCQ